MKTKITFLFLLISLSGFSQALGWMWADDAGGNSYDEATSVTTDISGNVYVCGSFYNDTIVFGTDTLRTAGVSDIFLAKYNSTGSFLWVKQFGGTSDEAPYALTFDLWGHLYFVGTFSSPAIQFGTTTLTNANVGIPDIFIAKMDANGNTIWAKKEGQADYDFVSSVVTDPLNGQVYIAGAYYANNITVGTTTLINNGLYDEMLIKYDTAGNVLWARGSGGTLNDLGNAVSIDKARNVYVDGGFASSSMTFGTTTLTNVGPGQPDIFVAKYDSLGNAKWAMRAGSIDNDHAVAIANDTNCNVFVAGHYHSASFNFASGTITNGGMGDPFLLKYDSSGVELWGNGAGGMDNDFGYTVAVDQGGNSYFSGMFTSSSITFGTTTLNNNAMDEDIFIVKYDPNGNAIWAGGDGGMGRDYINALAISSDGNLVACGSYSSPTLTLGSSVLLNVDTSTVTTDIFVGKMDVVTGMIIVNNPANLFVYPNPSTGKITVQLGNENSQKAICITNMLGEVVYQEVNTTSKLELDLSAYANGIYFITLATEHSSTSQKIILSR